MEQTQNLKLAEKLKRYTIFPLMAMGVLMGGMSETANANESSVPSLPVALQKKVKRTLSETERKEAYKAFKTEAAKAGYPKDIIKLVSLDTVSDQVIAPDRAVVYSDDTMFIFMERTNGICEGFPAIRLYDIKEKNIAEPLPPLSKGINTVTKKPYFSVSKDLVPQLSDKKYFQTLYKVLNQNFGVLMFMPVLNEKKIAKNAYAGKISDQPEIITGTGLSQLEKGMDPTEIEIRRQLGFAVNGAVEMMKAGGEISYPSSDCTGWTYHDIKLGDQYFEFVEYNGIRNTEGAIPTCRLVALVEKKVSLKKLQDSFHKLMQDKGVQPGTNPKNNELTADQKQIAKWGNALDNYIKAIYKAKVLGVERPACVENQKLKTLDSVIGKENALPENSVVSSRKVTRNTANTNLSQSGGRFR